MKQKWYKRIANWARENDRYVTILDRDSKEPYLERYYILPRTYTLGLFQIVIHKFWKSDDDGGLHDHPWSFCTYILENGYKEHTPRGLFARKPGDIRFGSSKQLHRIELYEEGQEVWTLFFMGRKKKEWGFVSNSTGVWVHWQEHLKNKLKNKV